MADRELRRMSRAELIEIIYVLQQQEQVLSREKEELTERLEEKIIRMQQAGSIAEAALSLNHIFEAAQAAAEQYLGSVKAVPTRETEPDPVFREAAAMDADRLFAAARTECKEAAERMRETETVRRQCEKEQEGLRRERETFIRESASILRKNPELAARLRAARGNRAG